MVAALTDVVQVQIDPDRVAAVRRRRGRIIAQDTIGCERMDGALEWTGSVGALEKLLDIPALRDAPVELVLSSSFARYRVLPWRAELKDRGERAAYARHVFGLTFGPALQDWELRVCEGGFGEAAFAAMMDPALLAALRTVVRKKGARLRSIKPFFAVAFNRVRARLGSGDFWFVTVEPGRSCIAHTVQSCWQDVRCYRIGADWRSELPILLMRERVRAPASGHAGQVHLYLSENAARPLCSGEWTPQGLHMPAAAGLVIPPAAVEGAGTLEATA
jgi:hypothetical protein